MLYQMKAHLILYMATYTFLTKKLKKKEKARRNGCFFMNIICTNTACLIMRNIVLI